MNLNGRRYLRFREFAIVQSLALSLSKQNITPNQISIASIFFAGLGGLCFLLIPSAGVTGKWLLPILAAVFIQSRLLCNLFDGLVAIEGGKKTYSGELFNDVPDRFSDVLLIVGAGYAITMVSWGPGLGWCAALLAVMTAYVRTLAASLGAPVNFQGPMAKQHRMALLTAGCLVTAVENSLGGQGYGLLLALIIMNIGCCLTLYRRTMAAYRFLESQTHDLV
ncbi:MAG: CDP-alcohol phosphatidyltransferase family protein [Methylococcales bacterium]|nr:CDP-alcohol phosphatidyltransferase family protein [Methylococcales bacterium]